MPVAAARLCCRFHAYRESCRRARIYLPWRGPVCTDLFFDYSWYNRAVGGRVTGFHIIPTRMESTPSPSGLNPNQNERWGRPVERPSARRDRHAFIRCGRRIARRAPGIRAVARRPVRAVRRSSTRSGERRECEHPCASRRLPWVRPLHLRRIHGGRRGVRRPVLGGPGRHRDDAARSRPAATLILGPAMGRADRCAARRAGRSPPRGYDRRRVLPTHRAEIQCGHPAGGWRLSRRRHRFYRIPSHPHLA